MEIEYTLRKTDLEALARHQIEHSLVVKRRTQQRRWVYALSFSVIAAVFYLFFGDPLLTFLFIGLAVGSYFLFPLYFDWLSKRYIQRIVQDRMTSSALAQRKLIATSEGLEQIVENEDTFIKWNSIDAIDTTSTHTFIASDKTYSIIIPKDQVEAKSYDEFVDAIRKFSTQG